MRRPQRWWDYSRGEPLQESAQEVSAYLTANPLLSLGIALVAGFAADRTVAYERRSGFIVFLIVGLIGLFLGEFMLIYFKLVEYLENISEFRIFFDFIVAYVGSFLVAAIIHFIKPT
jgi:uncharacterized membrane protein YeaQ/YmgE (transglycosylase-associated protein family)